MTTLTLSKSGTELKINKILVEKLGIPECDIPENAYFQQDLGIDSLDLYEIFMEVEKKFEIKIPDEVAEKIKTRAALTEYVLNR